MSTATISLARLIALDVPRAWHEVVAVVLEAAHAIQVAEPDDSAMPPEPPPVPYTEADADVEPPVRPPAVAVGAAIGTAGQRAALRAAGERARRGGSGSTARD